LIVNAPLPKRWGMLFPDPPPDVFSDTYGRCALDPCECLPTAKHPERRWKGTACPNWKPMGWTSFDQAIAETFDAP
jgi:hypothetical protein